jgi:hypothetical protein
MKLIKETYFFIFRKMSQNPRSKYYLVLFHINGSLAFLLTAIKHYRRGNKHMVGLNIRCVFWQLGETIKEMFRQLLHNNRMDRTLN